MLLPAIKMKRRRLLFSILIASAALTLMLTMLALASPAAPLVLADPVPASVNEVTLSDIPTDTDTLSQHLVAGPMVCQANFQGHSPYGHWYFDEPLDIFPAADQTLAVVCGQFSGMTWDGSVDGRHGSGGMLWEFDHYERQSNCQGVQYLLLPDDEIWHTTSEFRETACELCGLGQYDGSSYYDIRPFRADGFYYPGGWFQWGQTGGWDACYRPVYYSTITVTDPYSDCEPMVGWAMTGPPTGTVRSPATFTVTITGGTDPIHGEWFASGVNVIDVYAGGIDGHSAWADITWWEAGTQTVTFNAYNDCSAINATVSISITGISYTPPFSIPNVIAPDFPPDCGCPTPDFAVWQIGSWISWLWCNIKCWVIYALEYLYYLWQLLYTVLLTIANALLSFVWNVTIDITKWVDYTGHLLANWLSDAGRAVGAFLQMVIYEVRDWLYDFLTKVADWLNQTGDNIGDFLAMCILEVRDWLYDLLTGWADYFSSWGTGLGDFLAMATLEVRDWLYDFLTNVAAFINNTFTGLGDFLSMIVLEVRDWLYDFLTKLGITINAWATAIGDFLANLVIQVTRFINAIIVSIARGITLWIKLAVLLLDMLDMAVQGFLNALSLVITLVDLTGQLIAGLKNALSSGTAAYLFQDETGLAFFWRGLEFFEETASPSPLAIMNLVAIGYMGYNLGIWTIGQVGDVLRDVVRFTNAV